MFSLALVCLLVSRIMQKLPNQFSQNSVERWHMGHGRNDWILVEIRITLRYVLCFLPAFMFAPNASFTSLVNITHTIFYHRRPA